MGGFAQPKLIGSMLYFPFQSVPAKIDFQSELLISCQWVAIIKFAGPCSLGDETELIYLDYSRIVVLPASSFPLLPIAED